METIRLDVIAPTLQGLGVCSACELVMAEADMGERPAERALDQYPRQWQNDYLRLTEWVYQLADYYGDQILIRVIDPQSPQGLLKSLRHRIRHYPTWIVDGKTRVVGWDRQALEAALRAVQETVDV